MLAFSSFEYFVRARGEAIYLLFPVVTFIFFYSKQKFDFIVLKFILPFVFVFLIQSLFYGSQFSWSITLGIRLITMYFCAKIIGKDFIKIFIETLKVIAIISLVFYVFQYIGPTYSFMMSLSNKITSLGIRSESINVDVLRPNFIIYVMSVKLEGFNVYRNSGAFWEPGLYVIFLNIAFFLNMFITKKIINKTNLIFIIAILTTFSTNGFIVILMSLALFTSINKSVSLPVKILLFTFLIGVLPAIMALPFMSKKVDDQFNQSDISYSRFGAAVVHYNIVKDYPLTGMPWSEETYLKYADNISPNGITVIFVRYGLIAGIIYYILLFRLCSTIMALFGKRNSGFALFLVLVVSNFGQTTGNSPIYWTFIFSQIPLNTYVIQWGKIQKFKMYNYFLKGV